MNNRKSNPLAGNYTGKTVNAIASNGNPVPNNDVPQVVTIDNDGTLTIKLALDWHQVTETDNANYTVYFRQDTLNDAIIEIAGVRYNLHIRSFVGLWKAKEPKQSRQSAPTRKLARIQF